MSTAGEDVSSDSSSTISGESSIDGAPRLSEFGTEDFPAKRQQWQVDRDEILGGKDHLRHYLYKIIETKIFSFGILSVIMINTIFIGIHTSNYVVAKSDWYLTLIENVFLSVYVMELLMKIYVWRFKFFKSSWNVFDFVIVTASVVDFMIPLIVQNMANFNAQVFKVIRIFRAIRALRALRVLRTIRFLKNLQIIVSTVLQSIPAMGSIVILISLVLYIFAIVGRGLYSEVAPERFGNLARASFTLFQLITLDDWFFMYSDIRDKYPIPLSDHQHILVYLMLFIILETFIFINLFVAVIVDNLARTQAAANTSKKKPTLHYKDTDHESELDLTESLHRSNVQHQLLFSTQSQKRVRTIEEFYNQGKISQSKLKLLSHYWQILLSLEHHLKLNIDRQRTLNEVIDLVDYTRT